MSNLDQLQERLQSFEVPVYVGYAADNARTPYMVIRPVSDDPQQHTVCGGAVTWSAVMGVYCVAGGVAASTNLARDVAGELSGSKLGNNVVTSAVAYYGQRLEGLYESMVTIQSIQGEL